MRILFSLLILTLIINIAACSNEQNSGSGENNAADTTSSEDNRKVIAKVNGQPVYPDPMGKSWGQLYGKQGDPAPGSNCSGHGC